MSIDILPDAKIVSTNFFILMQDGKRVEIEVDKYGLTVRGSSSVNVIFPLAPKYRSGEEREKADEVLIIAEQPVEGGSFGVIMRLLKHPEKMYYHWFGEVNTTAEQEIPNISLKLIDYCDKNKAEEPLKEINL